jgi:hypothetical protein
MPLCLFRDEEEFHYSETWQLVIDTGTTIARINSSSFRLYAFALRF